MSIQLDTLEQRIVGVLIEKQLAVPESYPLTLNALVAGCNQRSNRDPKMEVFDFEVEGALRALMDRDWVIRVEMEGGRTMRYGHQAAEQLGVDAHDLAILSELLCRGPQSPSELKTRCARMKPFSSPAEVEERLAAFAARPVPYAVRLPRRPREKMLRWCHLLDGRTPDEALAGAALESEVSPAAEPRPERESTLIEDGVPPPLAETAPPPATQLDIADLTDRVEMLEALVASLTERLDRLEGR